MQTSPTGVVAAPSEEAPLKGGAGAAEGCGGARGVAACFGVLTLAVTAALLAQIYYHDYQEEGWWRGGVAAEARCSRVGAAALLAGGGALDAALSAAACLAAERPLAAPLHASGALLVWHYAAGSSARLLEWPRADTNTSAAAATSEPAWPHALCALCWLHASSGAPLARLPLDRLLAPAILMARESSTTAPLADYLSSLRNYTTSEIASLCSGSSLVRDEPVASSPLAGAAGWRVTAAGAAAAALAAELAGRNASDAAWDAAGGAASGLAVADARDNYVALVLGVPAVPGVPASPSAAASVDAPQPPPPPLHLAPLILTEEALCGRRVVLAGGAARATLQVAARLLRGGAADLRAAVEAARDGESGGVAGAAVNVVAALHDALSAHADSRGDGLAQVY